MTIPILFLFAILGNGHGSEEIHDSCSVDSSSFGPDVHSHAAGEENHGTEWFFQQPWAAREAWGSLLRDSALLSGMAVGVFFLSGGRRRR